MNELKELYDIKLTTDAKKMIAIDILTTEYLKTTKVLEVASSRGRIIDTLSKQEAIKYAIKKLGEEK